MLHCILPPDVENDRYLRLQSNDVGEVLIRSDAQINACRPGLLQVLDHVLKRRFIRHEVIGPEIAAYLGEFREHIPEGFVAELCGKGIARRSCTRYEIPGSGKREQRCGGNKKNTSSNCQHQPILT